jgi:TonB-linked SusC/RagA family outer membrane protein
MKKLLRRQCCRGALSIMKILSVQTFLALLLASIAYAHDLSGQGILDTEVSVQFEQTSLKKALSKIERVAGVKFTYSPSVIAEDQKVSVKAFNQKLALLLDGLLGPMDISYKLIADRISLYKVSEMGSSSENQTGNAENLILTVTGTVLDADSKPLPGASIVEKGTTNGTTTDADGKFSLNVQDENSVLVFSFIGYTAQEIAVNGRAVIDVALVQDVQRLDEVVVVGYGTQRKVNLTGSVASVSSDDIKTSTNTNLVNNLAGKLPGMRVVQRNSEPGDYNTYFDIRGWGSPLIIVDGVERDNFNRIDPNDIESISVLKDASAAVYGVKAANGVILVTTKKGKEGKTQLSYTATYGWKTITKFPTPLNAYEFATLSNESSVNAGNAPGYSSEDIQKYKDGTYPSTNWQDLVVDGPVPQMHHNLNISGGLEKVKYFISAGYSNDQGLWKSGDLNYNRYSIRASTSAQITDDLEATIQISGISDVKNSPSRSNSWLVIRSIWMQPPTIPVYANNNPKYMSSVFDATHPLAITESDISGYNRRQNKIFNGNVALDYTLPFVDGLKVRGMYAFDNDNTLVKAWTKKYALYDYDQASDAYDPVYAQTPTTLTNTFSEITKSTIQLSLNYEKSFNQKHNVKALGLFEKIHLAANNFWGKSEFVLDAVEQLYAGSPANQQVNSDIDGVYENANMGFIGRVNYDYMSKYLVEIGFRYDGSSKFGKGNQWGFFPYVSAGWRLSELNLIKGNLHFVDDLKIRASVGKLGDDNASSFQFLSGYTYPSRKYVFGNEVVSGLGFLGMSNPDITWYTATTTNIGLDGDLWNGLLNFQVDVFQRDRNGLLTTRLLSLPQTVGATLPQENLEGDRSRGFEIVLGQNNTIGQIRYNVSANLSYAYSMWTNKEEAKAGNFYLDWRYSQTNRAQNIWWGHVGDEQFTSQNDIYSSPIQDNLGNRSFLPGDIKYEDWNGDGMIDDMDIQPVGRGAYPEINYGINLSLGWKGIDLNVLLQGASNFNVTYGEMLQFPLPWGRNGLSQFMDRWHQADPFDPNSEWIPGKYPTTRISSTFPYNYKPSTYWIQDASYFRLKSLEIGYTIAEQLVSKIGIENLRFFANGYNLLTWSGVDFIDPEFPRSSGGYPVFRDVNFGVNVVF